jgi:hypothetical protein
MMSRFISSVAFGVAAAFLVVASVAFWTYLGLTESRR